MCGVAGIVSFGGGRVDESLLKQMTDSLAHRGPDGFGLWVGDMVGLGHRRLAIRDLTDAGRQPMHSTDGRYVVVFNGEIYNDKLLKEELSQKAGYKFFTSCDTEVIAPAFSFWGQDAFLKFEGMFAIAIWDKYENKLTLARDPVGIKPLYYCLVGDSVAFASEVKAILPFYGRVRLDEDAIRRFLGQGYCGPDKTMIAGIVPLAPGSVTQFTVAGLESSHYWNPKRNPQIEQLDVAVNEFNKLFSEVVEAHLVSDVPVGLLLSGGVDSCLIAKFLKNNRNVKAYTGSFAQLEFDEFDVAKAVAQEMGLEHIRVQFEQGDEIENRFVKIAKQVDGQIADSSSLAFYSVCEAARRHTKVVLTGDGADEFFGGYETYKASILADYCSKIIPAQCFQFISRQVQPLLAVSEGRPSGLEKFFRFVQGISVMPDFPHAQWRRYLQQEQEHLLFSPDMIDLGNDALKSYKDYSGDSDSILERCLTADQNYYLPGDMLVKADMMSMAHGLEVRVPFLDLKLIEFAYSLSPQLLVPFIGLEKKLLRAAMGTSAAVPKLNRLPKRGFNVPVAFLLRTKLKSLGEKFLYHDADIFLPYLKPDGVRVLWREHQTFKKNNGYALWALLTLAVWKSSLA